jgi:hypothetical protein
LNLIISFTTYSFIEIILACSLELPNKLNEFILSPTKSDFIGLEISEVMLTNSSPGKHPAE